MAKKQITVSLDAEVYAHVSEYAKSKELTVAEGAEKLINTGVSRLAALSKYAGKARKDAKKAAKSAKAPKAAAKAAPKKTEAKPKAKAAAKPKAAAAPKAKAAAESTEKPAAKAAPTTTSSVDRLKKLQQANQRVKSSNGIAEAPAAEA